MKHLYLHEAEPPENDLCSKYDIPSYEEYISWAKTTGRRNYEEWKAGRGSLISFIGTKNWSAKQRLAWTIVSMEALTFKKPKYLVVSLSILEQLLAETGEIPLEFEGCSLVFDENAIFDVTSILDPDN